MKPNAERTPAMAFIFITLLIDIMGFGLIIPVQPGLVQSLRHETLSQIAPLLGWLQTSFGLMQFVFAPILGNLSDKYGRRPVLLLSLAITAVEYVIMALAPNVTWLFIGRILTGASSASFTAASAYIADVSPPEKRAQNFGMIGAAFGLGFIIGPALGGLLGHYDMRLPFWVAAGLTALNVLYGYFVLPESLAVEHRREFDWRKANPFGSFGTFNRYHWVLLLVVSMAFLNLAQQMLHNTWVISNKYRFNWTEQDNGLTLALLGAASVVVQMVILRRLLPALGEAKTLLFGLFFQLVGFIGFGFARTSAEIITYMLIWSLSFVGGPAVQGLISKRYAPDEQGAVQGGLTGVQSLMGVISPLIATSVFTFFTTRGRDIPGAPFLLGSVFSLIAAVVAFGAMTIRRRENALTVE